MELTQEDVAHPRASAHQQRPLTQREFETLAEFRYSLREFLRFSEAAAKRAGLTPQQHQALLAIKGLPAGMPATVQTLADRLCTRHHSTVELVDRLVEAGLMRRRTSVADRRRVLLELTPAAERKLASLTTDHLEELNRMRPALKAMLKGTGNASAAR